MPTASKQKRKPFGTSSHNEGNRNNHSAAPLRPGKENGTQKSTSTDAPPRRDSKTPKASNLTTIGGAYGLGDDLPGMNPTRKKKTHAKSKQRLMDRREAAKKRPDPSPLKRPDPTAAKQSTVSLSKQPKKKSSVKSVISSAVKRSKSDQSKHRNARVSSSAEVAIANNPPDNNGSISDMDTAGSSPEKHSPLITSPHEKPDPPTRPVEVAVARRLSQKELPRENVVQEQNVVEQGKKRPAPQFAVSNQPAGNHNERAANACPSAAPMAPSKKRGGEDFKPAAAAAAAATVNNAKIVEAMMNSCNDESEESRVVGSFVGGTSLERSHADDMSEMTMMDDNASTTSMTTLGGNNPSTAHANKKKSSSSSAIPSQLNIQRVDPIVDPINTRQANLIDEETIASHITNQLKPGGSKLQPVDQESLSHKYYLPAGWKKYFSKSKNKPFWNHPDFCTTWHDPGVFVEVTNKQQSTESIELKKAHQPKSSGDSHDHRTDDESVAKNSASHLASSEFAMKEGAEDQMPEETVPTNLPTPNNEKDDVSTRSPRSLKQPDPSPLQKPDPTPTFTASNQSQPTSPDTKRISEDYQKLLAPYQSIEKSVASKALSVASSRQSKTSFYDDNSSKCLTQEFAVTKDDEEVGVGTPSNGNSVGELDDDNNPVEFDEAHDVEGYDEDDLMNDRQAADLNSLSSDHVDVDALLTQRKNKNDSPMSTIRETLDESAVDPSPSSVVPSPSSVLSSVDYGNDDGMSHNGSDDGKSSARKSDVDELSQNSDDEVNSQSSQETLSKSAIKDANAAGEELSDDDDDLGQYDNDDDGQSPTFESSLHDADDSDSDDDVDVAVSQHQSKRKRATGDALNLSLDLSKESVGGSNDHRKRKFFPPGPLCSLQFLDEIEDGDFDTPLWRRMKRKRSSLTSVKRGKAAYKAKKLRQSH